MVSFVGVLWNVQCNQRSPIHKQMTHMIWFFLDESESNQNENKIHMNRETESTSLLKESSLKVRVLCGPDDIRPERRASLLVTETRRWCWLNKTGIKDSASLIGQIQYEQQQSSTVIHRNACAFQSFWLLKDESTYSRRVWRIKRHFFIGAPWRLASDRCLWPSHHILFHVGWKSAYVGTPLRPITLQGLKQITLVWANLCIVKLWVLRNASRSKVMQLLMHFE